MPLNILPAAPMQADNKHCRIGSHTDSQFWMIPSPRPSPPDELGGAYIGVFAPPETTESISVNPAALATGSIPGKLSGKEASANLELPRPHSAPASSDSASPRDEEAPKHPRPDVPDEANCSNDSSTTASSMDRDVSNESIIDSSKSANKQLSEHETTRKRHRTRRSCGVYEGSHKRRRPEHKSSKATSKRYHHSETTPTASMHAPLKYSVDPLGQEALPAITPVMESNEYWQENVAAVLSEASASTAPPEGQVAAPQHPDPYYYHGYSGDFSYSSAPPGDTGLPPPVPQRVGQASPESLHQLTTGGHIPGHVSGHVPSHVSGHVSGGHVSRSIHGSHIPESYGGQGFGGPVPSGHIQGPHVTGPPVAPHVAASHVAGPLGGSVLSPHWAQRPGGPVSSPPQEYCTQDYRLQEYRSQDYRAQEYRRHMHSHARGISRTPELMSMSHSRSFAPFPHGAAVHGYDYEEEMPMLNGASMMGPPEHVSYETYYRDPPLPSLPSMAHPASAYSPGLQGSSGFQPPYGAAVPPGSMQPPNSGMPAPHSQAPKTRLVPEKMSRIPVREKQLPSKRTRRPKKYADLTPPREAMLPAPDEVAREYAQITVDAYRRRRHSNTSSSDGDGASGGATSKAGDNTSGAIGGLGGSADSKVDASGAMGLGGDSNVPGNGAGETGRAGADKTGPLPPIKDRALLEAQLAEIGLSTSTMDSVSQSGEVRQLVMRPKFTLEEDLLLLRLRDEERLPWAAIAKFYPTRTAKSLQVHYQTTVKQLSHEEWERSADRQLLALVYEHERMMWELVARRLGARYSVASCRLRYMSLCSNQRRALDEFLDVMRGSGSPRNTNANANASGNATGNASGNPGGDAGGDADNAYGSVDGDGATGSVGFKHEDSSEEGTSPEHEPRPRRKTRHRRS